MIDQRLQHLALGGEPETIVNQFGITRRELVLQMCGAPVERQRLDPAMREVEDRAAGRLVHAARLHADETILDEVEPPDAVATAIVVECLEQRRGRHALAIDRDRIAALEIDRDHLGRVGRVLGIDGARIDVIGHFVPRVLEDEALRRGVQHVRVGRKRCLAALVVRDRDLVRLGKRDQRGAAGQIPFAPRRDNLDVGRQRVIAEFEADLIVALPRRAVADGVGSHLARNLDLPLGDQRPRDRRAEQV